MSVSRKMFALALLFGSVERCFVSRMRDFFWTYWTFEIWISAIKDAEETQLHGIMNKQKKQAKKNEI